jgi:hypothetical protein
MIDLDIITDLDPTTGLPVVDHRSPAQRWSEVLNHGSEQNLHPTPLNHEQLSARSALNKPRNYAEPASALKPQNI